MTERAARRRTGPVLFLILCVLFLSACQTAEGMKAPEESPEVAVPSMAPLPAPEGIRIAVASDLHLDPDHATRSGELSGVSLNPELVEALLWDAKHQGAELILLTGDLVNGGKDYRHEALTERLRKAEAEGLTVCVVPGNHDLAPIGQREFAELYDDFGYAEAYSRDVSSLSYCVLWKDLMILMMDTAGYSAGAIDLPGAPERSSNCAFFSEETLDWVEKLLKEAEENGRHVLCAGHFNLLPEISRQPENSGYYLENGDRFAALLREYGVPLYLSGHQHTRAVYQENGLTELLTEYLLAYPTGYSMLDLTDGEIRYTPRRVDVDAWAAETGETEPVLLNYARWQQEELHDYARSNVAYMCERNPLSETEVRQAEEFFYTVMDSYWRGDLHARRTELESMPGYEPFFRCAEGYAYGWWLKSLIQNASPLLRGFVLAWK